MTRLDSDDVTYAEAGNLRYDLKAGTIEFSDNATITEGGNQISSNFLVYNIAEQRINAQSSDDGENRVRIIYTPRDSATETDDDANDPDADATTGATPEESATETDDEGGDDGS